MCQSSWGVEREWETGETALYKYVAYKLDAEIIQVLLCKEPHGCKEPHVTGMPIFLGGHSN